MVKTSIVNLNNPNILTVNNDTTIGEDSTDLMVVNSNAEFTGTLTVNSETRFLNDVKIDNDLNVLGGLEANTLKLNGTSITSTAAELNVLDPSFKNDDSIFIGSNPVSNNNFSNSLRNLGLGIGSLSNIQSGNNNIAIGNSALVGTSTGSNNIGIGLNAGGADSFGGGNGSENIAIGNSTNAAGKNTSSNVAIGYYALRVNDSDENTAIGYKAGRNTARAMGAAGTGEGNTAIGYKALYNEGSGSYNVCIGYNAGNTIISGYDVNAVNTQLVIGSTTNGSDTVNWITGDSSGNVGIGTDNPSEKLEVDGNVKIDNNLNVVGDLDIQGQGKISGDVVIGEDSTDLMVVNSKTKFSNSIELGASTSTTNGTLQWTGTKLQLYYNSWINISLDSFYSFNTFNFTNCGTTGRYGPSLTDCINTYGAGSYWWNNTSYFNVNVDGFQEWTVPSSGTYKIEAGGAKGGSSHSGSPGGNGAKVITYFTLTQSDVIKIIVGQQGTNGNIGNSGSGGGGGTYVLKSPYSTTASVIVVAGGGGGGSGTHLSVAGGNGGTVQSTTTTGGSIVGPYQAGGGAGFNNDGAGHDSGSYFTGGRNINNSSYPGHGGSNRVEDAYQWNFVGPGGFGGGGGNAAHDAGGGGGYNGGNSGQSAQNPQTASTGGGSYINSSGSSNSYNTHTGSHGYVTITKQ